MMISVFLYASIKKRERQDDVQGEQVHLRAFNSLSLSLVTDERN